MELSLEKIKQMSSEEIFDHILPTISSIYESYSYSGITLQQYYHIVLEEISNSKISYNSKRTYTAYLKDQIQKIMQKHVQTLLYNPDTVLIILDNYINPRFSKNSTYEDAMSFFKHLNLFFKKYDFIPDPDLMIKIIDKNEIFCLMSKLVFEKHSSQITSGNLENIFSNDLLINSIEAYCTLNDIEVIEKEFIGEEEYYSTDIVKQYLKEIGCIPLLTPEEEKELAIKMAKGDEKARKQFIEGYLKLVVSVAKKFSSDEVSLTFMDLIGYGNVGLIKAAERYDVTKGFRFTTYATWWIKQAISRAIAEKNRTIRIPTYLHQRMLSYKKALEKLEAKFGREPTKKELADELGISVLSVIELEKHQQDAMSLNAPVYKQGEQDVMMEEIIPSSDEPVEDFIVDNTLRDSLMKLFKDCNLKKREAEVLIYRSGLYKGAIVSLEEISKLYGRSRSRVSQIESDALIKIRNSEYVKEIAAYMPDPDKALKNIEDMRESYKKRGLYLRANMKSVEGKSGYMVKKIYELCKGYTKDQIDTVLSQLPKEEFELILYRYGGDLDNPIPQSLSKHETSKFYSGILPKIRKKLAENYGLVRENTSTDLIELQMGALHIEESTLEYDGTKTNTEFNTGTDNNNETTVDKEDCTKLLELIKSSTFTQMLDSLTPKEIVVVLLKFGCVDGKYFKTEVISDFLGITTSEVREIIKKVLLQCKGSISEFSSTITNQKSFK